MDSGKREMMKAEWRYVVDKFCECFESYKSQKIILYGIGKHTSAILNHVGENFNIIGLMDAEKAGEELWGYHIYSVEDLLESDVDMVVVIARPAVHQIIYSRIENVVREKGIPVYSFDGTPIKGKNAARIYDNPYFSIDGKQAEEVLDQYSFISFDIFDTLLMRRCLYPRDIFYIIDSRIEFDIDFTFSELRMAAEQELKESAYPCIDEIYNKMQEQEKFSDDIKRKLKNLEIEAEREYIIPRRKMVELYHKCIEQGKIVILISDMYLDREILKDILNKNNVFGYDELFISCEYGISKNEGLYEKVIEKYGKRKWIHVGDNLKSDLVMPQKYGADTFKVMSAQEMLENSYLGSILECSNNLYYRCIVGEIVGNLFNDPFALFDSSGIVNIDNLAQLSMFIAPLMLGYMYWTIAIISSLEISDIIFVARDGFLAKKIYELIKENRKLEDLPQGKYIYTSGRASTMAAIKTKEDLEEAFAEYNGNLKELLESVVTLESYVWDAIDDKQEILKNNAGAILEKSREESVEFQYYLKDEKIDFSREVVYFDVFSKGTGQDNFERILGKKLWGIYLNKSISEIERRNTLTYNSLFESCNHYEKQYCIFKGYSFLEFIFSSPEPCFMRIKNGEKIFYDEDRTKESISFLNKIQAAILDFCGCIEKKNFIMPHIENESQFEDRLYGFLFDGGVKIRAGIVPKLATYEWFRGAYKIVGELGGL